MWYYEEHNKSVGPVPESDLRGKLRSGKLPPSTLVWKEGLSDWQPASKAFPTVTAPRPVADANPYRRPQAAAVPHAALRSPPALSIVSMILGICSILLMALVCIMGILPGIPAVICGHIAMRQIKRNNLPGMGFAVTGLITGYIGILVSIVGIVFVGAVVFVLPEVQP